MATTIDQLKSLFQKAKKKTLDATTIDEKLGQGLRSVARSVPVQNFRGNVQALTGGQARDWMRPITQPIVKPFQTGYSNLKTNVKLGSNPETAKLFSQGFNQPIKSYSSNPLIRGYVNNIAAPIAKKDQFITKTLYNRTLNPLVQVPGNVKKVFAKGTAPLERGVAGLQAVGGLLPGVDDIAFAGYDYLKGARANAIQNPKQGAIKNIQAGLGAFSGEEYAGLGDALTTNEKAKTALNLAELPLIVIGGLKGKQGADRLATIKNMDQDIARAVLFTKGMDKVTDASQSLKQYTLVREVADKVIPWVTKSKEMKKLEQWDNKEWLRTVGTFLEDARVAAANPEIPMGFTARALKKDPKLIGIKNTTVPVLQTAIPETPQSNLAELANITQPQRLQIKSENTAKLLKIKSPEVGASQKIIPLSGTAKIGEVPQQTGSNLIQSVQSKANKLYTQVVDQFHPLSQIAKKGGQNQAMENALTSHYGAGSTANYHINSELSPILKSMDVNDLRSYTIAQRDLELAGRNVKGSDAASANQVLDQLKTKYGDISPLESTAQKLYDYQSMMVKKYLVDTGIISQEGYSKMLSQNQRYVPFKRVMDEVDEFLGSTPQSRGVGSVGSQNVIKGIKGSDRQIVDPLESIIENTYKIVGLGKRNQVAQTIVSLSKSMPDTIQPLIGEVGKKPVISVFENGIVKKYIVPEDVAIAAKGLENETLNAVFKILSIPTSVFRATATGLNPEFMVPNTARDLQSAFVNEGMNPLKFVSGLAHLLKQDEVYQEFVKSGATTSRVSLDRPYLKQTVGDITRRGVDLTQFANPLKLLQKLGEMSEQPTRIGMFETKLNKGIKSGLPREEALIRAAHSAQSGTVNFARRGSKMQAVNSLVAFLNARMQGTDQLIRSFKKDPKGVGLRLALVTQVPAVTSYMWNRNFASYNDERVVSKNDKQNNFIIMLSDTPIESLRGAQFIKIPKGDVGKFANPTEQFLSYVDGRGGDTLASIAQAFGGLSPVSSVGDVIPTAIKPIVENTTNYSTFQKKPIVPDYMSAYPKEYQSFAGTPEVYKKAGQVTGQSPLMIQNLTSGYLTGYEKIANPILSKVVGGQDTSKGQDINQTPIIRRFLGGEKMTVEEQTLSNDKKANSNKFKVNDIKGAINKGVIPFDEGVKQIQKIDPTNPDTYYQVQEFDKATGQYKTVIKTKKGEKTSSNIYNNLSKEYVAEDDSPKNLLSKVAVYGAGMFADPKGTLNAIKSGQPVRKVRGDAVIVERMKNLGSLDQGDKATQVDHVIPLALGGTNDESNLQVISSQDNQAKGVVDTYLAKELEAGRITKKVAQERDLNWRAEIATLPANEKAKAQAILAKVPVVNSKEATKDQTSMLEELGNREYEPILNNETGNYSDVQVNIPEYPKLTGLAEADKKLKSSYYSALTTAKKNIEKLYLAGQITAEEFNSALIATNTAQKKAGKGGKKAKKIKIGSTPTLKKISIKAPQVAQMSKIDFKIPTAQKVPIRKASTSKPRIKLKDAGRRLLSVVR